MLSVALTLIGRLRVGSSSRSQSHLANNLSIAAQVVNVFIGKQFAERLDEAEPLWAVGIPLLR